MKHFYIITIISFLLLMLALPFVAIIPQGSSEDWPGGDISMFDEYFDVFLSQSGEVVRMSMEEYLFGVVTAEISFLGEDAAVKSQIVASYTFALYRREQRRQNPDSSIGYADISDNIASDQAFLWGEGARERLGARYEESRARFTRLMGEVGGKYLQYDGRPILAVYHAVSAGRTESAYYVWGAEIPYLQPAESVGDLLAPDYLTTVSYTPYEFLQRLTEMEAAVNDNEPNAIPEFTLELLYALINEPTRSESGYVLEKTIGYNTFTGRQIREHFALRSANFDLAFSDDAFVFTVRGYGHGVGMSQFGARYMAEQGSCFEEILNWFFSGAVIATIG